MTDGEWWRKSGPWSSRPGGEPAEARDGGHDASDDSVYDTATAPGVPGMSAVPLDPPREAAAEADPDAVPPPQVIHSGGGGWDLVMLNFSDAPAAPPKQIPDQRAGEGSEPPAQPEAPEAAAVANPRKEKKAARAAGAAGAAGSAKSPKKSALAGRRPSPLLLLAAALLAGGAWTGFFPAMLAGWGLGYLSSQLKDLTRKFAIFGIPLITMSATTLYQMRQTQHGQAGAGPGSQLGQMTWASAPGVLRLSAALTAAFLLLMALRRRPQQQQG
ncbi:hypothetical protein PUR71_40335 [Streptomyces sp. SP17BM10]|uniref:hypothetical protein n=1 Tax=Streptomyces sp. SP17BM10 TaxID=3002530 RepID=UPI002E794DA6|nr:hypothetical protein [Streptomyces sp. SP17BM10]MEE1789109.1 hypothetical protein [Streptomyces sp. SP17BM10]